MTITPPEAGPAAAAVPPVPRGPQRHSRSRANIVAATLSLTIGTIVFALVVGLSFSLAFERSSADLSLRGNVSLTRPPEVVFAAHKSGWTLMPDESGSDTEPRYSNETRSGTTCLFSWFVRKVSTTPGVSDYEATTEQLERLNLLGGSTPDIVVHDVGKDRTGEFVYSEVTVPEEQQAYASVSRVFAGSGDIVLLLLVCEDTGELDQDLMLEVVKDVTITVQAQ